MLVGDTITSGVFDQILYQFLQAFQGDFAKIQDAGKQLFYWLAGIQISVSLLWMMLKGDGAEAFAKGIQMILTMGIFYSLITLGGSWMPDIINGFIGIGSSASGISSLSPSSIMDQGLSIGFALMDSFANWGWLSHPEAAILASAILIAIVLLYSLLAAEMAVILIKSYLLVSLSGLMFAFGANESVREMALNYFKAVIGIGLQLLAFYLLMGVGVQIGHDWATLISQAAQSHDLKPFFIVAGAVIFFYVIVKSVPPFIAGLSGVSGFKSYGGETAAAAIGAGAMGANALQKVSGGAFKGVQGAAQAGKGAILASSAAMQHYQAGRGVLGSVGKAAGYVHSSFGNALKDSIMKENTHMSFGQKFNAHMADKMNFKPNN